MVSVIIPTYNRARLIERSVNSVLNQTYSDLEVIVVDDCSIDNTADIIKSIMETDGRLRYYRMEKNSGACAARNKGIEMSMGNYIAFQDSDDEWELSKIELQLSYMIENKADICFCQFKRYDSSGEMVAPTLNPGLVPREVLLAESVVSTQTIVASRQCFDDCMFDVSMPRLQDYDICIRLSEKYDFYFLSQPLVNMYVQNDSISMSYEKLLVALERLFDKYPMVFRQNKDMDFYQTRYLANTKEQLGKSALRERIHCFLLRPSLETAKKVVKSIIS